MLEQGRQCEGDRSKLDPVIDGNDNTGNDKADHDDNPHDELHACKPMRVVHSGQMTWVERHESDELQSGME